MDDHKIVSHEEWVEARKTFLAKEKELTRMRDAVSKARRELPWERVEKPYVFDGPNGEETLSQLFQGNSQLVVYHFMYGPGWSEGCKSCSFLADHFDPAIPHMAHRDVTMVTVSKAPLADLQGFQERMGWTFKWVSSSNSDFNRDYQVSFTEDELDKGGVYYNYSTQTFPSTEAPGVSVFCKNLNGDVFHTYSSYQRGLDMFITAYHYLDLVPKGRDEENLSFTMDWVRLHDSYEL